MEHQEILDDVAGRAVAVVDTKLQDVAELAPEALKSLSVGLQEILKLGLDLLLDTASHCLKLAVLLKGLTADVESEVLGVDNATNKVEIIRQELLAMLLNHDVAAEQLRTLLVLTGEQVVRRLGRDEQEDVIVEAAFGVETDGTQRIVDVVELALVELGIILVGDFGLGALPNRNHAVDCLDFGVVLPFRHIVLAGVLRLRLLTGVGNLHDDGVAHIVAVLLHELLELVVGEIDIIVFLGRILLKVEDDVSTVCVTLTRLDGISLDTVAFPYPCLVFAKGTRNDLNLLRNHEAGVETNTELADDVHVPALLVGVLRLEFLGVGMGNGTEVAIKLILGHADAVI